ncbi:MAG: IS3 family transposase [Synechococcales bacterium]|nr:IS3 family transposase [Synechococcales bacterium]
MARKQYSAEFKTKIALEAIKGQKTINEMASAHELHPTQITQWEKQALESIPAAFSSKRDRQEKAQTGLTDELYQQIGQLKVELDWLKKNLGLNVVAKRALIEPDHPQISLSRQCELLDLNRSSWYYEAARETPENEALMQMIDQQFTQTPFYEVRRMTAWLRQQGHAVNPKRVRRFMKKMGSGAVYPQPKLSLPGENTRRFPYLLKDYAITAPNQVWSTDITYIRLSQGFVYLVAIIDWFSRYVLAGQLCNTMDVQFCLEALEQTLSQAQAVIFNSDQGAQFSSLAFTQRLEQANIQISQDGKGRAYDNILVERLWRSVKYEEVYLKSYNSVAEAIQGLDQYFQFYNHKRLHQSLNYCSPATIHFG